MSSGSSPIWWSGSAPMMPSSSTSSSAESTCCARAIRSGAYCSSCAAAAAWSASERRSFISSVSCVRYSRSIICRITPPPSAITSPPRASEARLIASAASSAGSCTSEQLTTCLRTSSGASVWQRAWRGLGSAERLYSSRRTSGRCAFFLSSATRRGVIGEATIASRRPLSKERLYSRRSVVASSASLVCGTKGASASTTFFSLRAGRFSLKTDSFLRNKSTSTSSSEFCRLSMLTR
mmetsp:Transcript_45358/g.112774  ORF Transcript_45358/g.112774 Transcript_45358/m.112774 type:complete len:237 (+) Transcript_45358:1204-1914(+)